MLKSKNKYNPKLKPYHIIFLSFALCPFLIINSNSVNKKREEEAQLNEDHKFLEKLYLRKLDFESDVDAICKKGSDDLKEYYTKGDPKSIGIDDNEKVESEDNPPYINALINLVSSEGEMEENAKEYVMHLLPVIAFLALAFLSLPIWFVYCICCCSNCCCCCCCKKSICRIPFFIVAAAFYALVFGTSVYGLSQSNSIFVGLADTECSLLKFIGEVLDGETKETRPKWAGISGIKGLFQETINQINGLTSDTQAALTNNKASADNAKDYFESALQAYSGKIKETSGDDPNYKYTFDGKDYYLDIVYNFGTFTKGTTPSETTATPDYSFVWKWYEEFKLVTENSEQQMQTALNNYHNLLGTDQGGEGAGTDAMNALDQGINSIGDIEGSFNDVKDQISGAIIDYSDKIEEYGKLSFKIIFSVFMVLDIAIAAFITLLLFCSFKFCENCCCFRCLFKSLLHILWNILAFLTFLVLLLGSIFTLIGTVGKDLISVVSFLVSDENLNKPEPILLEQAKEYLKVCINGNGDIRAQLNLNTDGMGFINQLRDAANQINILRAQMNSLKDNKRAYNDYYRDYKNRVDFRIDDFELLTNGGPNFKYNTYFNNLNSHLPDGKTYPLSSSCIEDNPCNGDVKDTTNCINPKNCGNDDIKKWYGDSNINEKIINAFINSIFLAKDEGSAAESNAPNNILDTRKIGLILKDLEKKYNNFIQTQIESLGIFSDKINGLADIFNRFAGEGSDTDIYSIINCKFIGRNVKIILKNLEESLGQSFYNVGLCLVISGISMLVSIAFTILLNTIIAANSGK